MDTREISRIVASNTTRIDLPIMATIAVLALTVWLYATVPPSLTAIIQKRRLMLFGHLARMDETADARRSLTGVRVGQLGAPTPPGWTTYLCTILPSRTL